MDSKESKKLAWQLKRQEHAKREGKQMERLEKYLLAILKLGEGTYGHRYIHVNPKDTTEIVEYLKMDNDQDLCSRDIEFHPFETEDDPLVDSSACGCKQCNLKYSVPYHPHYVRHGHD